jgi:hypothetical protein
MLLPLLIAGYGRSGTTAVMNLLATDPHVAVGRRAYPFEDRYLTYFAKLAAALGHRRPDERFTPEHLCDFEDGILGPCPWGGGHAGNAIEWLAALWSFFCEHTKKTHPQARFYAEKVPPWVSAIVRQAAECRTIYLFRDPRDMYLSANAFITKRNYYGFGRSPSDTDHEHARNLAFGFLNYFENYWMDRYRADCTLLRYEDLTLDADTFVKWTHRVGLDPHPNAAVEFLDIHRTSSDPISSVGRWRREAIPAEVNKFFEQCLGSEMRALNYAVASEPPYPSVEFRSGSLDPNRVPCSPHGRIQARADAAIVEITGHDFWLLTPFESVCADEVQEVWVSALCSVGDHCSIYWRAPTTDFSEERRIHVQYQPSPHWRVIRFRVGQHPNWQGTIQQIRIDLFNEQAAHTHGVGYVRWVRLVR